MIEGMRLTYSRKIFRTKLLRRARHISLLNTEEAQDVAFELRKLANEIDSELSSHPVRLLGLKLNLTMMESLIGGLGVVMVRGLSNADKLARLTFIFFSGRALDCCTQIVLEPLMDDPIFFQCDSVLSLDKIRQRSLISTCCLSFRFFRGGFTLLVSVVGQAFGFLFFLFLYNGKVCGAWVFVCFLKILRHQNYFAHIFPRHQRRP